jgi:hypothetical protein
MGLGLGAFAVIGLTLGGCASRVSGNPSPAGAEVQTAQPATVTAPPSVVVIQPPATVVQPPVTVTQPPKTQPPKTLTSCQRLYSDGYSFAYAYDAWVQMGYPQNWDADHDGLPCEQSYGERN